MTARLEQAVALHQAGELDAAVAAYREALREEPGSLGAGLGLGLALFGQGKLDEAAASLANMPVLPQAADTYFHIAMSFLGIGRPRDAEGWFRRMLAVRPGFVNAEFNLGLALQNQGRFEEAMACYRRVLQTQPDQVAAYQNLALLHQMLGLHDEAIAVYREGMQASPADRDFPRYLVGAMFYAPALSNEARFEAARESGARLDRAAGVRRRPVRDRDPERRLRIGYLTSDFRDHPIGRNVEPLLAYRDRARFEIVVYADIAQPDGMTAHLKSLVDGWRDIGGLTDEAAAELIDRDAIDILVSLAGHFDRNRPGICAFRPAPLQVSFHDVTTSGSAAFDYLIADRIVCPAAPAEGFTERVFRLPGIYVHTPMDAPMPRPVPAGGPITFGCFNNPAKLNDAILAIWARVLAAVPGSRLVLKYRNWFRSAEVQERVLSVFAAFGVPAEQIDFAGGDDDKVVDHLRRYETIDIALDPYPFGGSTATFEALWMGVPVVTLAGTTMMSRWSSSLLRALKLDGLIAQTPEQYIAIARHVADDQTLRTALRTTLRDRMRHSPLCDGRLRARQIERTYRAVWRRWCRKFAA